MRNLRWEFSKIILIINSTKNLKKSNDQEPNYNLADYMTKFKNYMQVVFFLIPQEGLTNNIINFVNRLISESTTLNSLLRSNNAVHKPLFKLTKNLFLNETELVYLSIYLERFGWEKPGVSLEDNLLAIGLISKVFLIFFLLLLSLYNPSDYLIYLTLYTFNSLT